MGSSGWERATRRVNLARRLLPIWVGALVVVVALQALGLVIGRVGRAAGAPLMSAGCGRAAEGSPGASIERTLSSGGQTRAFRLHLPLGYTPGRGFALVLDFHGDDGDATQFERYTGLSQVADRQGFLVAYPQGLPARDGQTGWAGVGEGQPPVDDVRFTGDLLTAVQNSYCVDRRRIYAMGFSRGGGMAALLACRLPDRIAAFAAVSGAFFGAVEERCAPARPVPILEFHGDADDVVPYLGGGDEDFLPIPRWLQRWAARDACDRVSSVFYQQDGATGERWTGCARNALVEHFELAGAGHAWPGAEGGPRALDAGAVAWTFFQAHPLT